MKGQGSDEEGQPWVHVRRATPRRRRSVERPDNRAARRGAGLRTVLTTRTLVDGTGNSAARLRRTGPDVPLKESASFQSKPSRGATRGSVLVLFFAWLLSGLLTGGAESVLFKRGQLAIAPTGVSLSPP